MNESFEFVVKRPARAAFELLTDLKALAEAGQGHVRVSPVTGRPPTGPGSALTIHLPLAGAQEVLCETVEWDEPRRCVRRFDIPDLPATLALDFEEQPDGRTKILVNVSLEAKSMLYKMMLPMLSQKIRAQKEEAVREMQKRLDQDA
ncbi:MAG TPA: SRPBCC family protein [Elusimicrobiota bacterium]|jgi:hypothetical protein|nr:SRPBCC family protein [Elusimicrobiota bacterium]